VTRLQAVQMNTRVPISWWRKEFFFSPVSIPPVGLTQANFQWISGVFFPRGNAAWREDDNSSQYSAKLKNDWECTTN
jgi:hypothetical protein